MYYTLSPQYVISSVKRPVRLRSSSSGLLTTNKRLQKYSQKLFSWSQSTLLAGDVAVRCQLAAPAQRSRAGGGQVAVTAEMTGGLMYSVEITAIVILTGLFFVGFKAVQEKKGQEPSKVSLQWKEMQPILKDNKVTSLGAYEVKNLVNSAGYAMLDVRPSEFFQARHPRGAVNIPLFEDPQKLEAMSSDGVRSAILVSQGIRPTRENPNFLAEVAAWLKDSFPEPPVGLVLMDASPRGTLNPSGSLIYGEQSRALVAAYLLVAQQEDDDTLDDTKLPILVHLEGGVDALYDEGFPQDPRPGIGE